MSTTPHKARTEVWAAVERFSRNEMDIMNCVLELRARVEALEAHAGRAHGCIPPVVAQAQPTTRLYSYSVGPARPVEEWGKGHTLVNPAPADSLVERVATTLRQVQTDSPWIPRWEPEARAAIREVAVAARGQEGQPLTWEHVAQWLEQEADR